MNSRIAPGGLHEAEPSLRDRVSGSPLDWYGSWKPKWAGKSPVQTVQTMGFWGYHGVPILNEICLRSCKV